eukprot:IDg6384t1
MTLGAIGTAQTGPLQLGVPGCAAAYPYEYGFPGGVIPGYFPKGAVTLAFAPSGAPADDARNVLIPTVEARLEGSRPREDAEGQAFGRGEVGWSQQDAANPYASFESLQPQRGRTRLEGWKFVSQNCPEHARGPFGYRVPLRKEFCNDRNKVQQTEPFYIPYSNIRMDNRA